MEQKKLSYRIATENDLTFIIKVYNENIEVLHGMYRDHNTWKRLFTNEDQTYYVVYSTESVAWFRIDVEENSLCLGMLQVAAEYQRQEIGRYILSIFEEIAAYKKVQKLVIHTTDDNIAAKALYLSAGYEITEYGKCTTADGKERMGYTFEKELSQMLLKEVELNEEIMAELIALSESWEMEDSCYGYRKNTPEDIEGNRIFLAIENSKIIGYLFGHVGITEKRQSIYQKDEAFFEIEELYVRPEHRSHGIGKRLF